MSVVAHRAFAQVPSEANFEGLTERLVALRTEIDAILVELASHAMGISQAAALMAEPVPGLSSPSEEPAAAIAPDVLPVLSDPPAADEAHGMAETTDAAPEPSVEAPEPNEPCEMVAVPEQPIEQAASPGPVETESEAEAWTESACDEAAPMAAVDTDAAERNRLTDRLAGVEIAPIVEASAEIAAIEAESAEPQQDAAKLEAPRLQAPDAAELAESEVHPRQLAAELDGAPVVPVAVEAPQTGDRPAMPAAAATVISLSARQRKHKGGIVIGPPARVRSSRFLAAKIAAGILVLLTAAALLVMADRTAFGSVPSLNWMSQTPSVPTGIDWLLQRIKASAAQSLHNKSEAADLPLDDGPLASSLAIWGL